MAGSTKKKKDLFRNDIQIDNRKARFDYEIIERLEAGIELDGSEVKSLRQGGGALTDVHAVVRGAQVWLRGMHIKPYAQGDPRADPTRERRLLLNRKEINRLMGLSAQKGLALVPLRLYFTAKGWAKLELGLCRGKKAHDKRDSIRERDLDREMRREFKTR